MASFFQNMTIAPGNNWTNTSGYNCGGIHRLPLQGDEILIIVVIYLSLISMYCVSFIDVALKQTWPKKFLDKEVMKRVESLWRDFPGINAQKEEQLGKEGQEDKAPLVAIGESKKVFTMEGEEKLLGDITYDAIASMEPYVSTCCVDEDLTFILANHSAYNQVSSYCSSTTRGYVMLSTMLPMNGVVLGFLWIHNAMINPIGENYWRYISIIGYTLVFLTGSVMCPPNGNTVHRKRNILLWDSVPITSKVLNLHELGIHGFCVIPLLGNLVQLLFTTGAELPNRTGMWIGIAAQVFGLLVMLVPPYLAKHYQSISTLAARQLCIIGEIIGVFVSILTYAQIESYSAAACAQTVASFDRTIVGAMVGVLVMLCVKHYAGAPIAPYTNNPSVLLTRSGIPVATSGPVPVLNFNREAAILPIVQPK